MYSNSYMNKVEKQYGGGSDQLCWKMGWQSRKPLESLHTVMAEEER